MDNWFVALTELRAARALLAAVTLGTLGVMGASPASAQSAQWGTGPGSVTTAAAAEAGASGGSATRVGPATGAISTARDEALRRERRNATQVAVLDRAVAGISTELIGERIARAPGESAALGQAGGSPLNFAISSGELFAKLAEKFPNGISVWASGGFTNLMGAPEHSVASLRYRGDSLAAFAGADSYVRDNLLAGAAIGYTSGNLNFSDRAGSYALSGELHNRKLSLHPYLGWRIRPNLQAWLVLGFGTGDVDVQETEGAEHRALDEGSDSTVLMGAAGVDGSVQVGESTDLKLRLEFIRAQSRVASSSFDDSTHFPRLRAVSSRAGSSVEVGHRFALPNGMELRPFGLARLRMDRTHNDHTTAVDIGAGAQLNAPIQGITGRFSIGQQLNSANHEQRQFSALLEYDMGSDALGLGISLQSTLASRHRIGAGFGNAALASSAADNSLQQSLRGELSYGVASRAFGAAALLTPYARFELRAAERDYATGLRLRTAGLELGLEAALAATPGAAPDPQLLLRGALRF